MSKSALTTNKRAETATNKTINQLINKEKIGLVFKTKKFVWFFKNRTNIKENIIEIIICKYIFAEIFLREAILSNNKSFSISCI